jgi:acyl-[acyl-carrier-protein]-phospholipid O-acyltransferase/long-chain-fatty-acid--[acyl-carrier-protein] ligase
MTALLRWLLRLLYGFRAFNESALKTPGPVLLLPNHVSWWDWLLMGVCLEKDWRFVTSRTAAELSWFHKKVMVNRRTFPVDINSPYAVKHMAEYLQRGGRLVLFPEGRLSCTGSLMKLFDGTGFLIHRTHAKVITAYIRGAYRLPWSPNPNRKRWFPRLSVHFSNVLPPPALDHLSASESRALLTDWLWDQMVRQRFETEMEFGPARLPEAILETARQWPRQTILEDATLQSLTYRRLAIGADVLAADWHKRFGPEKQRVGVLLPNVNALPVVMVSLWAANKIPAVLNYTTGPAILLACARLAELRQVITSRTFIQRARLDLEPLKAAGIDIVFLEDVRAGISSAQKFLAMLRQFPKPRLRMRGRGAGGRGQRAGDRDREAGKDPKLLTSSPADDVAVILFTSGSEGDPKGVELTHRNVLANIRQMLAVIDLMDTDRFFNALPLFHSFGLNVGMLLPLVQGTFVFLYVSPLHYRVVPAALYNLDCTVFFGTNTFLNGYARKAHPYDFRTLRYLFAGAEKLQPATSAVWMQKFGVRIIEGYGATECSPCVTANVPMRPREGSPGRFLPGIECRLEPVEGIATDASTAGDIPGGRSHAGPGKIGRLHVRGPNIMRGYLNPEANARFQALGGWYDTGDIVRVDTEGFVFILGRLKRFAKVSGEMVSLAAVEDALANAFARFGPKFAIAVVSRPDEARGERLIAVTNEPKITLEMVREAVRAAGLSNLAAPRELKVIHEIPRLGTGKVNHRELERMI